MTFIEAKNLLASLRGGEKWAFLFAMSGTSDQLELYLRAHAARAGHNAVVGVLPFGTLGQHLYSEAVGTEVFLVLPWDLVPECDWRVGIGEPVTDVNKVLAGADKVAALLKKRKQVQVAYLAAPIPPVCAAFSDNARLAAELTALAVRSGATLIAGDHFSLSSYLSSGAPVAGNSLSSVAQILVEMLLAPPPNAFKVLATDADNTLWAGLVGEDGVDAVSAEAHGRGFRHYVYQYALHRLKVIGVLLAVVSRNDEDLVRAPLDSGHMPLKAEDFVSIRAGYGAKSDQLLSLAASLNLGVDSIVFVDDNPVELAEVGKAIPGIICQAFPTNEDELPGFLNRLIALFDRRNLTIEDSQRTDMYRRRLVSHPTSMDGAGLSSFLASLGMVLSLRDRTAGDWKRALQLINKTNQFNLNGHRMDEEQFIAVIEEGGRILTATLEDRTGSHGEILACLVAKNGKVLSLVMPCRVFQRRVEYAFVAILARKFKGKPLSFAFLATARNEPMRNFLADPAFTTRGHELVIEGDAFISQHISDLSLFAIHEEWL